MEDQIIVCPNCGTKIPLTETLFNQVKEKLTKEYEARADEKERELLRREEMLAKERKGLEDTRKAIEQQVEERLKAETEKLKQEARKEAETALSLELKDMQEQSAEKDKRLEEARKAELELRKKAREMEEQKKGLDLELARRIDEEREKIKQNTLELFSEEHRLKDLEKEKKIGDMLKTIDELKRKGEQGSMQTQGEVAELDLESLLKSKFPADEILPVPKGIKGADILQKVYDRNGQYSGTMAWETKSTKAWNNEWISKLKDDQREIKAEIAVIVSKVLPEGVGTFTFMEGVWVATPILAGSLAEVLRTGLIQVSQTKLSAVGKNEKMEVLYNYLSGPEFKHKLEAIVEAFTSMKADLDKEKRAMTGIWAKREKQIERVIMNTSGMYGDMQGMLGASLPQIKMLEMGAAAGEEDILAGPCSEVYCTASRE